MSKIILDVDKNNLDTVMTILDNLNPKLINNISIDNKIQRKVQNIEKKPIQKPLEDEFIPKTSSSKYLSRNAYKQKLINNK